MKKAWISAVLTLIFIASHSVAAQEASGSEESPQVQEGLDVQEASGSEESPQVQEELDVQDEPERVSSGSESTGNTAAGTVKTVTAPPVSSPGSAGRGNPVVNSPGSTGSVRIVLPPSSESMVLTINTDTNGNFEVSLDPPPGASAARSVPADPGPSGEAVRQAPGSTTTAARQAPPAKVIPKMPASNDRKHYTVQVGAFANMSGADRVFRTLSDAGFRPAHERCGDYNRVIIPDVPAADIPFLARQLGTTGIKEVWIRE
ncbi:hypothetical protein AGMMS50267_05850 [Spirochaetia bacterium]|nr:hypothetical protein AGMMS50267_05850 [Spirochaetia bacterium]